MYYEKGVNVDLHLKYMPVIEPVEPISILNVKMVARYGERLVVAYFDSNKGLSELNLSFDSARLAIEWEVLLTEKK